MRFLHAENYWGFLLGVVVLAGCIVNPYAYMYLRDLSYLQSLVPSLFVSAVVAVRTRRDGNISWIRFFLACVAIFLIANEYAKRTDQPLQIGGGFLMFLSTFFCGWVGESLWELYGPKKE